MWNIFKKKEKGTEHVIVPQSTVIHIPKKFGQMRRGMWVDYQGRVGILYRFDGDKVEVHLVDQDGLTEEIVKVPMEAVRQANKHQVPECRRGNIDNFDYPE